MASYYIDPTMLRKANEGDAHSILGVIDMYFTYAVGLDIESRADINKEINDWYTKLLSSSTDPIYILKYANFLRYEIKDLAGAFEMKKIASSLCAQAMESLGADYYEGIPGVMAPDPDMARECWSKAENMKAVDAILNESKTKISDPYVYYYFSDADIGFSFAYREIEKATGLNYEELSSKERMLLQKKVYTEAFTEHHILEAAYRLYLLLWYKLRKHPDFVESEVAGEAFCWLSEAANNGYIPAMSELSAHYKNGIPGVLEPSEFMAGIYMSNYEERKAFCKALSEKVSADCYLEANRGDSECRRTIAKLFGKPYDYLNKSETGYLRCYHLLPDAMAGNLEAQELLADNLIRIQEINIGLQWRKKAADAGHLDSLKNLARNYEEGILGVLEADTAKGAEYRTLATDIEFPSPVIQYNLDSSDEPVMDTPSPSGKEISTPTKKKGLFNSLFGK